MTSETGVPKSVYKLGFFWLANMGFGVSLFGSTFCVVWTFLYNFEAGTKTHCKVDNYLPTVSTAIGEYSPQKYVWRICVVLLVTPRLLLAIAYYSYHTSLQIGRKNELYRNLAALNSFAQIVEVSGLVGLSNISSTAHYDIHKFCFTFFMLGAIIYMSLTIFLFSWGRTYNGRVMTYEESSSLKWKKRIFAFNISSFALSIFFFIRHNSYCDPGAYTFFAVCEYMVVLTNIFYHATATYDFAPYSLAFARSSLLQPTPVKHSAFHQQNEKSKEA